MDDDRKYKQRGYMGSDNHSNGHREGGDRPRPQGPKLPLDVTGPRLPRMVQSVTASRCFNCSTTLPEGVDFKGNCPKCNAVLHCCKQCANFEPSTRFQCLKPIPVRIPVKDMANECELFNPRMTVAREVVNGNGHGPSNGMPRPIQEPRTPSDARAAFDNLFKKE